MTCLGKDRAGTAVPWVSVMLYGVVLAAGLYYDAAGHGSGSPPRTAGFVAVMTLLLALEAAERRWPSWAGRRRPLVLLAVRLGLIVAAAALDSSGESRALFLLVPFAAYFAFGRIISLAIAAACLALLVADFTLRIPHWYAQPTYLSAVLMFTVGLVLAIAMASIATAHAAQVAELSAVAERIRLARDIHDSLGHHLTAIAIQLEKAAAFRERDQVTADQALADARSSTRQALHDIRISVRALRDDHSDAPLSSLLAGLVRQAGTGEPQAGDPQVSLAVTGEEGGISATASTVLYRSAQEALTNARRHSGARKIAISATFGDSEARLVVADDGCGFDSAGPEGFGLLGMRERAALAGGRAEIDSRPGGGTTVTVTVPRSPTAGPPLARAAMPAGVSA